MRIVRCSLVLLSVLASFAPAAAHAAPSGPFGCEFMVLAYPGDTPGRAEIDGGPVTVTDDAGLPVSARLTCSLGYDGGGAVRHTSPTVATASGPATAGVVAVPPSVVDFDVPPLDIPWLCARVDVTGGPTYYWDAAGDEWTTDPTVLCENPVRAGEPDPVSALVFGTVDAVTRGVVDPAVCPVLATALPPDGDVPVWDCSPYDS